MAKKAQPNTSDTNTKIKKAPGIGAAFGSVILFIITFLTAALFLTSAAAHATLKQNAPVKAMIGMQFCKARVPGSGYRSFSYWLHHCYMWNSENLTPEYSEAVVETPEFRNFLCYYLEDLEAYLLKESDDAPMFDVNAFCDVFQYDIAADLQQETGILFAEADRAAILYNAEDDVAQWNEIVSRDSFGKSAVRFLCTLPGVITTGALTGLFFLLWLILAVCGGWRKGRMLTACGTAIALPSLIALLGSGILLLLVYAFDCIPFLSFASVGMLDLLLPLLWSSAAITLCGMIIASIGICINSIVKTKKKKARLAEMYAQEQPAAPAVSATPEQPEFTYAQIQEEQAASPDKPSSVFCPHCGAENEADSKFCGSCGGAI